MGLGLPRAARLVEREGQVPPFGREGGQVPLRVERGEGAGDRDRLPVGGHRLGEAPHLAEDVRQAPAGRQEPGQGPPPPAVREGAPGRDGLPAEPLGLPEPPVVAEAVRERLAGEREGGQAPLRVARGEGAPGRDGLPAEPLGLPAEFEGLHQGRQVVEGRREVPRRLPWARERALGAERLPAEALGPGADEAPQVAAGREEVRVELQRVARGERAGRRERLAQGADGLPRPHSSPASSPDRAAVGGSPLPGSRSASARASPRRPRRARSPRPVRAGRTYGLTPPTPRRSRRWGSSLSLPWPVPRPRGDYVLAFLLRCVDCPHRRLARPPRFGVDVQADNLPKVDAPPPSFPIKHLTLAREPLRQVPRVARRPTGDAPAFLVAAMSRHVPSPAPLTCLSPLGARLRAPPKLLRHPRHVAAGGEEARGAGPGPLTHRTSGRRPTCSGGASRAGSGRRWAAGPGRPPAPACPPARSTPGRCGRPRRGGRARPRR